MEVEIIKNLFDGPKEAFLEHLKVKDNNKIIFSGRFGIGKTTFLDFIFSDAEQKRNFDSKVFNVVKLFPVNYSVATNEDIFRYIKYDIILELLNNKELKSEEVIIEYIDTLPGFLSRNAHRIFAAMLRMVPEIGKSVLDSFDKLEKLKEEYFKEHDEKATGANQQDSLYGYLQKLDGAEGNIFEDDIISNTIELILKANKESNGEENVLVIDDLDRIDPEHIFRILNVFAAHIDRKHPLKSVNKFGFDRIILVCDLNNIREIFKSKYGIRTDFNGYIDKFFSHRIFEFSNKGETRNLCSALIRNAEWSPYQYSVEDRSGYSSHNREYFLGRQTFLNDMINWLLDNHQLDLRNILKWKIHPIKFRDSIRIGNVTVDIYRYPIIFYLQLLSQIKGDHVSLKEAVCECQRRMLYHDNISNYVQDLILIATIGKHRDRLDTKMSIPIDLAMSQLELQIDGNNNLYRLSDRNANPVNLTEKHLQEAIIKTIDVMSADSLFF